VDGEAENGGEGEGESEGQVGMEEESEGEAHRADLDQGESDGDKVQSSPERELDDQRMEPDARGMDSEDEGYQQRTVSSRRRGVVASESEGSEDNYYADGAQEDEELRQTRKQRLVGKNIMLDIKLYISILFRLYNFEYSIQWFTNV
jgi:RNA polymerase-associated protein LEO1